MIEPTQRVKCPRCGKMNCYDIDSEFNEFLDSITELRTEQYECGDCQHKFKIYSTFKLAYYSLIDEDGNEGDTDYELVPDIDGTTLLECIKSHLV